MSLYGAHWSIDGVPAAFITRGRGNGQYRVLFEREFAELPAIEAIDWSQPAIQHLAETQELGLPEGYGFEVEGITYDSGRRSYTVALRTARQYLGDVTGYQARITELQAQADGAAARLAEQEARLADAYTEGGESYG